MADWHGEVRWRDRRRANMNRLFKGRPPIGGLKTDFPEHLMDVEATNEIELGPLTGDVALDASKVASHVFQVPLEAITGRDNSKTASHARYACWSHLQARGWTLARIGDAYGRTVSSVGMGLSTLRARLTSDPSLATMIDAVAGHDYPEPAQPKKTVVDAPRREPTAPALTDDLARRAGELAEHGKRLSDEIESLEARLAEIVRHEDAIRVVLDEVLSSS